MIRPEHPDHAGRSLRCRRHDGASGVSDAAMKTGQNCRPRAALYSLSVVRSQALLDSDVDPLVQFVPGEKTYDRFRTLSELLEAASAAAASAGCAGSA
jgi:hypothetical protein